MFQGFYNLSSGMMTNQKNLSVISNNLVNVKTPGYRADTYVAKTFQDEMFYRMGNMNHSDQEPIGRVSMARVSDGTVTDYEQGGQEQTNGNLDFAISGNGFFKIALDQGGYAYTRDGSFSVDDQGNLVLPGVGRVQGLGGDIVLDSDAVSVDSDGMLYDQNGDEIDQFDVVDFDNYAPLVKGDHATFTTDQPEQGVDHPGLTQGYLEQSNVDVVKETSSMMQAQRSIQSAAQILKMYDSMMGKAVTEIGKV